MNVKDYNLNSKQLLFCQEYASGNNGTQAAIKAGYAKASAYNAAHRLLKDDEVQRYIADLQGETERKLMRKYEVTQDRLMKERASIAFSDIRQLYNENGELIDPKDWDDKTAAAIASYKPVQHGIEIRFWNKPESLLALEKIEGMYELDNSQQNPFKDMSKAQIAARLEELKRKALED